MNKLFDIIDPPPLIYVKSYNIKPVKLMLLHYQFVISREAAKVDRDYFSTCIIKQSKID